MRSLADAAPELPGPIVDVICIPTTSGTGSEVSPVAVVTDPDRFMKVGIATRRIIPKWAVVDPSLCVHGTANLRVADASIMPTITSGNTNAPTIVIAERAAQMMILRQTKR